MGKKGQTFQKYTLETKMEAVRLVNEEHRRIREVTKQLGIRNKTQVQVWNAKYGRGEGLGSASRRRGRPKTKFTSIKEERAYLRAEIEYLKKQYPNLHKE